MEWGREIKREFSQKRRRRGGEGGVLREREREREGSGEELGAGKRIRT